MAELASTILTLVFGLGSLACTLYVLYRLTREKGGLHALLGILFPPYPYVWGWINGGRLGMLDIMVFWTFVTIGAVVFPLVKGAVALPGMEGAALAPAFSSSLDQAAGRGSIAVGQSVQGHLDDLMAVDEWTLSGAAGQVITIRCSAAPGHETDPRVTVIGPNGQELASDDDGGDGFDALIAGYRLPQAGVYRIQVDVWSGGGYILTVDG